MKKFTATEARNNFTDLMVQALKEPVCIEKNGVNAVVMLSYTDYELLKERKEVNINDL